MMHRSSLAPAFGLRREVDRLFDDMFGVTAMQAQNAWTPAVDIRESDSELSIVAELPGLKPDQVEVTCDNGVLSIRGEKSESRKEGEEGRWHLVERSYGSFSRSFQLPQGIDESKIEAGFDNGLLTVRIPKAALPQPKRININAGGAENRESRRIAEDRSGQAAGGQD
jgi:HSP20 family protein